MILRLTTKLAQRIKVKPKDKLPLDPDPLLDWSAHTFFAGGVPFILVTNTASLYSTVFRAKGVTNGERLVERILSVLGEVLRRDMYGPLFENHIAPAAQTITYSKSLNLSVTGCMNGFVYYFEAFRPETQDDPYANAVVLNGTPMGPQPYRFPRETFAQLALRAQGALN